MCPNKSARRGTFPRKTLLAASAAERLCRVRLFISCEIEQLSDPSGVSKIRFDAEVNANEIHYVYG